MESFIDTFHWSEIFHTSISIDWNTHTHCGSAQPLPPSLCARSSSLNHCLFYIDALFREGTCRDRKLREWCPLRADAGATGSQAPSFGPFTGRSRPRSCCQHCSHTSHLGWRFCRPRYKSRKRGMLSWMPLTEWDEASWARPRWCTPFLVGRCVCSVACRRNPGRGCRT